MIEFSNVSKGYGDQIILQDESFFINDCECVGLVGMNGAGKSTVFELITGEIEPDRGKITKSPDQQVAHLRQTIRPEEQSLSLLAYAENALPEISALEQEIQTLEHDLHEVALEDQAPLLKKLGDLQSSFEAQGGYHIRTKASVILGGLGFPESRFDHPISDFSGGWQMRAELARTLTASPDILLLDEPSNFLDMPAVEWLQRYLRQFKGTLLLISHDRYLLNSLTGTTLEIAGGRLTRYRGSYEKYIQQREQRMDQLEAMHKNQQRKREQIERFVERFRSKNTLASRVKSKIKMLERMEEIERPVQLRTRGRLKLPEPSHSGHEIVRLEDAGYTYNGKDWVLRHVDLSISRGQKIALVGLNGMGKTTLLRLLAGHLSVCEGRRILGHKVVPGYQSQETTETVPEDLNLIAAVKHAAPAMSEQMVRGLLGSFGFSGDAVMKQLQVLSGGERIRLAFARLLANPPNFLILDEPTTHLDIPSREQLEDALCSYPGTLCFVSHDVDFVRRVADHIISMEPPGIKEWNGGYDYFKQKSQETVSDGGVRKPARNGSKDNKKNLRRERAEARRKLNEKTRPLKQQIAHLEKEAARLEKERGELVEVLSSAVVDTNFQTMNRRLCEIQDEIEESTARWEKCSLELEDIEVELT